MATKEYLIQFEQFVPLKEKNLIIKYFSVLCKIPPRQSYNLFNFSHIRLSKSKFYRIKKLKFTRLQLPFSSIACMNILKILKNISFSNLLEMTLSSVYLQSLESLACFDAPVLKNLLVNSNRFYSIKSFRKSYFPYLQRLILFCNIAVESQPLTEFFWNQKSQIHIYFRRMKPNFLTAQLHGIDYEVGSKISKKKLKYDSAQETQIMIICLNKK